MLHTDRHVDRNFPKIDKSCSRYPKSCNSRQKKGSLKISEIKYFLMYTTESKNPFSSQNVLTKYYLMMHPNHRTKPQEYRFSLIQNVF